jgi:ABC-type spermidine/putrescine transport system permease subunit II
VIAAAAAGRHVPTAYREIILPMARPDAVTGALLASAFNAGAFAVALLISDHMRDTWEPCSIARSARRRRSVLWP